MSGMITSTWFKMVGIIPVSTCRRLSVGYSVVVGGLA